ncbi:MAG TPA: lysophospholipid acyltransferase family protein [Phycisphaerales bacterium]|nr:lysophospholipid acyltransferase family protein [Phycisphaerales bacterium]
MSLAQRLVYWSTWNAAHAALTVCYGLRRYGLEHLPRTGPVLIVSNHQSYLDPPIVCMCSPRRQTNFIAKFGLFEKPLFAKYISTLNSIPIRDDGEADLGAMREALARLSRGEVVLLFPEGTRSPDGAMQPFLRGATVLVKRAKCPIVPAALEGAYDAWPRGSRPLSPWGKRVAVMLGPPIAHDELMKDGPDAALTRLSRQIDAMRLELREKLRKATNGRYPPRGVADGGSFAI